jgi:hypothetical protein
MQGEAADRALEAAAASGLTSETVGETAAPAETARPQDAQQPAPQAPADKPQSTQRGGDDGPVERSIYDDLLHRYHSDRGRMADLRAKIAALEAEIKQLKASGKPVDAPAEPGKPHLQHVTAEERQDFGEHVLDVQARVARGEAEAVLARIKREAEEEEVRKTAQAEYGRRLQAFWGEVEKALPGAAATDEQDPRWWKFCEEGVEPISGRSYMELAQSAIERGDVQALVRIFEEFWRSVDGMSITGKVAGRLKPKTARTVDGKPDAKRMVPESEVKQFYTDVSKGKFVNRPEDARRMEQEYEAAVLEGRIILGA